MFEGEVASLDPIPACGPEVHTLSPGFRPVLSWVQFENHWFLPISPSISNHSPNPAYLTSQIYPLLLFLQPLPWSKLLPTSTLAFTFRVGFLIYSPPTPLSPSTLQPDNFFYSQMWLCSSIPNLQYKYIVTSRAFWIRKKLWSLSKFNYSHCFVASQGRAT